jgi:anti-sigma factor RsiW
MRCTDCRDAINAYVDQELLPDEQRDVRDHLASCPDCQREHDVLVVTTRTLKEGLVRHRAPDVLKARIRSTLARSDAADSADAAEPRAVRPSFSWAKLAAAGALIAVVSSGLTFAAMRQQSQAPMLAAAVLTSHIRSLMPGHLVDIASNDQHNVKPWFNGRLDVSPTVPRLDSLGFPLLGGRVDYIENRPVAAVVYGRRQHIINVFSWPAPTRGELRPSVSTERGYHLVHWRRDGLELWAVSDLNLPELRQFVSTFDRQ